MNEKQAWLALAEMWDKAQPENMFPNWPPDPFCEDDEDIWFAIEIDLPREGKILAYGLCRSLDVLNLPYSVEFDIREKIDKVVGSDGDVYKWNHTELGAKQRAAFCRRMADECN